MTAHHFKPSDQYNRLLSAFGLGQTPENTRTHFTVLADLLNVSMASLSDCIRRGFVTDTVLEAAKAKGVNPDFITTGTAPVHLEHTSPK
ncbi:MAG: hypothetical protein DELT_01688 [Desulfovibrio sp.]